MKQKINYKNIYEDITKNSLYALERGLGVYDIGSMPDAQYGGGCKGGGYNL